MSSIAVSLASVQQYITRYVLLIPLILGNFGNLVLIAIFSQRHHRHNSCSLYLIAAAIFSLVGVNWGLISNIYAAYRPPDPFVISDLLCRIRAYILQSSSLLYKIMILLACFDRFALTSTRIIMRKFTKPKAALKIISGATLFGLLISIHLPIFETVKNNRCSTFGTYGIFFGIYMTCVFGLILPILTILFAFLILKNLKEVRGRVHPIAGSSNASQNVLSRRDINLIKLVLAEVAIGMVFTSIAPVDLLYAALTSNVSNKSLDRIAIESFIGFFGLIVLFYLNYCATFYLYVAVSKTFRQEIKQFILKCVRRPEQEQGTIVSIAMPQR